MKLLLCIFMSVVVFSGTCFAQPGFTPYTGKRVYTDERETIAVRRGQEFSIMLDSNRTTGYQWELASPLGNASIRFVSSEYIAPKSTLLGAGGKERWTFQAMSSGSAELRFLYKRPWEKGTANEEKNFRVVVK